MKITSEWGWDLNGVEHSPGVRISSEEEARREVARFPKHRRLMRRLVGPWAEAIRFEPHEEADQ